MTVSRPFREVKLQWLQQLSCDAELSDNAKCVALYIITTHLNGHTEKAWPSYQTIADATGKSVKTIQRAIRELEATDWFDVRRGNGVGHNTEYRPSASSILRASESREKTDKIVRLYPKKGGQICPERQSDMSLEGGQKRPLNPEKEINKKPNARGTGQPSGSHQSMPLVFLMAGQTSQVDRWLAWLAKHRMPPLAAFGIETKNSGRGGYRLPSYWPPSEDSPEEEACLQFFRERISKSSNAIRPSSSAGGVS
ncbi:helix-turn-helix domain-containing protein [Martelella limonii]|uniref:helix-turn-helix domain-containing protein n=1 Tax=Martelella limonii TaxID=1647649 RepID=UPI00158014BB|nr:helix-turn-helix domain-containing protein [Martelella limonii]